MDLISDFFLGIIQFHVDGRLAGRWWGVRQRRSFGMSNEILLTAEIDLSRDK